MTNKRWRIQQPDEQLVTLFQQALQLPTLAAKILVARGFQTVEEAQAFLHTKGKAFHP